MISLDKLLITVFIAACSLDKSHTSRTRSSTTFSLLKVFIMVSPLMGADFGLSITGSLRRFLTTVRFVLFCVEPELSLLFVVSRHDQVDTFWSVFERISGLFHAQTSKNFSIYINNFIPHVKSSVFIDKPTRFDVWRSCSPRFAYPCWTFWWWGPPTRRSLLVCEFCRVWIAYSSKSSKWAGESLQSRPELKTVKAQSLRRLLPLLQLGLSFS